MTIPSSVIAIYESAFSGCSKLSKVYYSGTEAEWNEIVVKSGNDCLLNARLIASDSSTPGDIDGDEEVTVFDAIYLFNHAMFPDLYPVDANRVTDYNGDGEFDMNDAIYLFNHTMFPDLYPI